MERFLWKAANDRRWRFSALLHNPENLFGIAVLAFIFFFALANAASAHEFKLGSLTIEHPWSRATPPGASVGGGYLAISNSGATPDRLVGATAEVAGTVEIHKMAVENGIMKMGPVGSGLEIPARGTVKFAPSAYHLMLMNLKRPLKQGETFRGTLTFEKAGTVNVEFAIEAMGAAGPAEMSHGH